MMFEIWLAFCIASTVLLVIPGPTILTVIAYSIANGRSAALPWILAVALADATALTLSVLGLGSLLAKSAFLFQLVKVVGGCYLIYLGVQMLRSVATPSEVALDAEADTTKTMFWNTYLVTALNPKGIVFFIAFFPQFIDHSLAVNPQLVILGLSFVVLATLNSIMYVVFADRARGYLASEKSQKQFKLVGGSFLSGAGLWAVFSR
jgi:threonine/homoserine/homoserine lactone efflux protein